MKGVIASICPEASVIDLTHAVAPRQVREGAFHLEHAIDYFPAGTLFVCVVDPGVGTARRPIGVDAGVYRFVAPDNGLLTPVFDRFHGARCHELSDSRFHLPSPSATFHGRDIFSPVAAHLASGVPISRTGPAVEIATCRRVELFRPRPLQDGNGWEGEAVCIDRFGNIVTSIDASVLTDAAHITVSAGTALELPFVATYADVAPGMPLAYAGSSGMVEIAIRDGNASRELSIGMACPITLRFP